MNDDVRSYRDRPGAAGWRRLWWRKWRWYGREQRLAYRARVHLELARRGTFARGRLRGDVLALLREDRLVLGPHVLFEDGVWLTSDTGRITIGEGSILNVGVMVAALHLVEIGRHCLVANGCVITDADHRTDDPTRPMPWQGFTSRGPVVLGDNVWLGAGAVVTSGVRIGERAVVGANSVVTSDVAAFSVVAGAPARVIGEVSCRRPEG